MSERQGVEIDYCPKCRGVWLDRGELDKIIERSTQEVPTSATQSQQVPPAGPWGHENDHHRDSYRKKSIWKEIFD
jgi:hypothetical protein